MKLQVLLIVGSLLSIAACAKEEQPAPEPAGDAQAAAAEPAPADDHASVAYHSMGDEFVEHMHAHAEQLDNLNFALADDDLDGAMTAAYWLAGHQEVTGLPAELQPFLAGMRAAAREVEQAPDLDTARAAAERISEQCQGCHDAAGVRD